MKKLPQWKYLLNNFPNKPASEVFTEIGGKVKLNYDIGVFSNACATRMSKALNFSGVEHRIPFYKTKDSNGSDIIQVSSGGGLVYLSSKSAHSILKRNIWAA